MQLNENPKRNQLAVLLLFSIDIVSACTKRLSNAKAAEKNTENDGDDGYAKSESNQSTEYHTASSSSSSGFSSNRISMRDILDELQELSNEKHSNPGNLTIEKKCTTQNG